MFKKEWMIDMMEQKTILIVDDENMMREAVASYLEKQGYHVLQAETGTQALSLLEKETVSFVILDLMLPDISGEEICSRIRRQSRIPIIMLTAKTMEDDMLNGLNLGADDYITKPFGIMELLSRVKAVLRRSHVQKPEQQQVLSAHDLTIDLNQRTVVYLETEIVLTYKEFELLSYLVRNRGSAISRDRLLEQVWGFSYEGETRTVDAHVKTLRQKLEAAGCTNLIHTVRGYGYKIGG